MILISIGISLAVSEAGLRIYDYPFGNTWIPEETRIGKFDPETGWSYKANYSSTAADIRSGAQVNYYFNNIGARSPSPDLEYEHGKPTILFVGGSFTMGHGLNYEQTYTGLLAEDQVGTCQIINLGVQGFGTDQSLIMLKRHIKDFNTVAVIYTFIDDHILRNNVGDRRLLFRDARFIATKPLYAIDNGGQLFLKQAPYNIRKSFELHLWSLIRLAWYRHNRKALREDVPLTRALIEDMRKTTRSNGADFHLVYWRKDPVISTHVLELFSGMESSLDLISIELDFKPRLDDWYMPDGHPNFWATAYAASIIRTNLTSLIETRC